MSWFDLAFKVVTAICMVLLVGMPTVYWPLLQADPEVTPCEAPYIVDATLKPRTAFKPGETFYTVRNDKFQNKVAGPLQRSFIRDDGLIPPSLPPIYPPKLSPNNVCSKAMHGTQIPLNYPAGWYTYNVTMFSEKNPTDRSFAMPFPAVRIQVVE